MITIKSDTVVNLYEKMEAITAELIIRAVADEVKEKLDIVSPSSYFKKQESVARMIDVGALKEVAEILDDVLHREPPFIMLLKGTVDIDVAHSREQFLEHYVEYAVGAIKGLLYESNEGD